MPIGARSRGATNGARKGTREPAQRVSVMDELDQLKTEEDAKRERNWDRAARLQVMQETLTWADEQATDRRHTPGGCLAKQQRLLAGLADWQLQQAGRQSDR